MIVLIEPKVVDGVHQCGYIIKADSLNMILALTRINQNNGEVYSQNIGYFSDISNLLVKLKNSLFIEAITDSVQSLEDINKKVSSQIGEVARSLKGEINIKALQ